MMATYATRYILIITLMIHATLRYDITRQLIYIALIIITLRRHDLSDTHLAFRGINTPLMSLRCTPHRDYARSL